MISASSANTSVRNRSPFTATQWQELEHQALIYKYMVSGVPIPPDLIYSVKRSLDSAPFSSRLFSHHPGGWGCFEMGFGRKVDPEPGRCRRTDGKKWRCSKEAYPDSKYCERHMHRGRNRSRKHVEVSSSSIATAATSTATASNTITSSTSTTPAISPPQSAVVPVTISAYSSHHHHQQQQQQQLLASSIMSDQHQHQHQHQHTTLYPYATDYAAPSSYFCLKSEPYSNTSPHSDKDYRYFQGSKEGGMDELAFFPESSVSSSGGVNARGGFSDSTTLMENYTRGYQAQAQAQYHHQTLTDTSSKDHHHPITIKQQQQHQSSAAEDQQHCFILGTDFKSERSSSSLMPNKASLRDQSAAETQKPLHHFFGEWPPKNTPSDSWLDLASNSRVPNDG